MSEASRKWLSRAVVFGGIAVCVAVACAGWPKRSSLPGMALGSPFVLVAERAVLMVAAWLFLLVVASEAWAGRLPIEISGRGVRYADVTTGQAALDRTEAALRRHDFDIEALRREIADLGDDAQAPDRDSICAGGNHDTSRA